MDIDPEWRPRNVGVAVLVTTLGGDDETADVATGGSVDAAAAIAPADDVAPDPEAGVTFGRVEGILPAPEATHVVKGAVDAALEAKESGEAKTILFNLCGHGHFDMQAYSDYFAGKLTDQSYAEEELTRSLASLPKVA